MLIQTEIRFNKESGYWYWNDPVSGGLFTSGSNLTGVAQSKALTKRQFVKSVTDTLKTYVKEQGLAFSLRICGKDDRYVDERTFPKSADPRKSKG